MKLFRYMSRKEFELYQKGIELVNLTNHVGDKNTSIGFCFMEGDESFAKESLQFLSGIVDTDVCCIFEIDERELTKTQGKYAKPIDTNLDNFEFLLQMLFDFDKYEIREKWCTTRYDRNMAELISYCENIDLFNRKEEWIWKNIK